jgi:hypothetical protein
VRVLHQLQGLLKFLIVCIYLHSVQR